MAQHPYPLWHPVYWLATWFYSGLSPKAPGTVGTLAALPFAYVIVEYMGAPALLWASLIVFFIGWFVSTLYVRKTGREDPKEVVIDEVAGMWLLCAVPFVLWHNLQSYILLFLLFRLLDIGKPWFIGLSDRHVHGGLGIMLDDMLAGLLGLILILVALMAKIVAAPLLLMGLSYAQ